MEELQAQLDRFRAYYNQVRPHRAVGRRTPAEAFAARTKAGPKRPAHSIALDCRVRRDRIDKAGKVTLRFHSRLIHIGVGRAHAGQRVIMLIAERDVRIIRVDDGQILRHLIIDPTRQYQPHSNQTGGDAGASPSWPTPRHSLKPRSRAAPRAVPNGDAKRP